LNQSDEEKYTFENVKNLNIKNLNVDNFDLDEFINEENSRILKRQNELSNTNISFFNMKNDEVLNLDFNQFIKGNINETKNTFINRHHSNSVNIAEYNNQEEQKTRYNNEKNEKLRAGSERNIFESEDIKIINEVLISYILFKNIILSFTF